MSGQIQNGRHIIACLEERLGNAYVASSVSGNNRRVIAYFGLTPKPEAQAELNTVSVAGCDWTVEWRNTSDATALVGELSKCPLHGDINNQHNLCIHPAPSRGCLLPFWRGSGDDMAIQKMLHCGCVGDEEKTVLDDIRRVDYNSFRSAIFSYKPSLESEPPHSFMLSPASPHEGDELGKRIEQTLLQIKFLNNVGLDKIRVCVLKGATACEQSGNTAEVITRNADILKSNVRERLRKIDKVLADKVAFVPSLDSAVGDDVDFEIERAIQLADLIVPFDGSTGNLLARLFTYASNMTELYSIPWFIRHRPWPVGEGAFNQYEWKQDSEAPLKRAIMWKVLESQYHVR